MATKNIQKRQINCQNSSFRNFLHYAAFLASITYASFFKRGRLWNNLGTSAFRILLWFRSVVSFVFMGCSFPNETVLEKLYDEQCPQRSQTNVLPWSCQIQKKKTIDGERFVWGHTKNGSHPSFGGPVWLAFSLHAVILQTALVLKIL